MRDECEEERRRGGEEDTGRRGDGETRRGGYGETGRREDEEMSLIFCWVRLEQSCIIPVEWRI